MPGRPNKNATPENGEEAKPTALNTFSSRCFSPRDGRDADASCMVAEGSHRGDPDHNMAGAFCARQALLQISDVC